MRTVVARALGLAILSAGSVVFASDNLRAFAPRLTIPEWANSTNPQLCKALLSDLRRWRNVSEIKPIAAASSIDSGEITANFGKCDSRELLTSYQIEPRVWRENNLDALSEEERKPYGSAFVMTGELKIYRANIDNDPTGSKELVVYGSELATGTGEPVKYASRFHVLDIEACKITNSAQAFGSPRNTEFVVGLLRHGARNYIFSVDVYPNEFDFGRTQKASVTLQRWTYYKKTNIYAFSTACNYEAKDD
jgi:hypothetical protein